MDAWAESDLAWELADVISPLLADRDRAQLYATIGSGESYTAIDTALQNHGAPEFAYTYRARNQTHQLARRLRRQQ